MIERILFVDDDPKVLGHHMRRLQETLEIDMASGGEDGLKLLGERGPYAVVVANMEMSDMSGTEFLAQVRQRAPKTVRIALTEHMDIDTAMAAVNQGHVFRFLRMPCQLNVMSDSIHAGLNEYRQAVAKKTLIEVKPLHPRGAAPWTISLDRDIMAVLKADGTRVVEMFRDEAARYMRFDYVLFRGMTVTISIIPGLKGYSFVCGKESSTALLAWLPHKTPEETQREIRLSGIGVGLLGALQLILPQGPFWGWGALLLLTGVIGMAAPRRSVYSLNSLMMLLVGLVDFIAASPTDAPLRTGWSAVPLGPVFVGGMLFLWAAHQISLMSLNQHLRTARALRDKRSAFLPACSAVVQWVGHAVRWVSLVFATYTAAVVVAVFSSDDLTGRLGTPASMFPDLAIFGVMTMLLMAISKLISLRKRPAYVEAQVAAQLMISVLVLALWSICLNFDPQDPPSFFGHIFTPGLLVFDRPYAWGEMSFFGGLLSKKLAVYARPDVWISLALCVFVFNRWFMHKVDEDLEEQLGLGCVNK